LIKQSFPNIIALYLIL